jgi:hypothetical protein
MYLLKVRYGKEFASTAGSVWRVIFVVALFPWLRKYRFPQYPNITEEFGMLESGEMLEPATMESDEKILTEETSTTCNVANYMNSTSLLALDAIQEEKESLTVSGSQKRKSLLTALPFLVLEPEETLPRTEKEAIVLKRRSLTQIQQNSIVKKALVRSCTSERHISSTVDLPLPGSRRGELRKGVSLAEIKGTPSSKDMGGREALLQFEVDSLRNQNRELQKQLRALELSVAQPSLRQE